MSETTWNPWKATTIGIVAMVATALVTGVVVANYVGRDTDTQDAPRVAANAPSRPAAPQAAPAPRERHVAARPSAADIEDCNRYAASARNTAGETLKDALIGGAAGAGLGAAGGAIADGGSGAGKGAGIGGILGAAAGTLYGLHDASHNDAEVATAYRVCMRQRGFND